MNTFEKIHYEMMVNQYKIDIEAKILEKALQNYDIETIPIPLFPDDVMGHNNMKQQRYRITYVSKQTGLNSYTATFLMESGRTHVGGVVQLNDYPEEVSDEECGHESHFISSKERCEKCGDGG